jgi:hypothetical protein
MMLEVCVPETTCSVCLRYLSLRNTQQLHDKIVDFDILEPIHHVGIIRGRVPTLAEAMWTVRTLPVVSDFRRRREGSMSNEYSFHCVIIIVVAVILQKHK